MSSININLLPQEVFERRRDDRIFFMVIVGTAVLVFILFLVYVVVSMQVSQKERLVDDLSRQSDQLKRKISVLQQFEAEKKKLQEQDAVLSKATAGEVPWHEIFYEVGMVIPSDVWLTSVSSNLEEGTSLLRFKGYTFEHPSVAEWLIRLSEVKSLTNVWLEFSQEGLIEGQPVVEFETSANLAGVSTVTSSEPKQGE